jgi:replicative DNA helicase
MSAVPSIGVPPHNLEAEKSVLGAVLLDERHLYPLLIEEHLRPEHFYREQHGAVFAAMIELYQGDHKIDHLTVAEKLREQGKLEEIGGPEAIDELAAWVPTAGHARDYGRIVRDNARMRALLTTSYEIQASVLARDAPPRDLLERAERSVLEIAQDDRQKTFRSVSDILAEETDKLHRLSIAKTALTGTPSGFKDIDDITGGFQPGNMIVIAARPSMGKSALVANIAESAALQGHAVALFSLEMSESELAQRFVASQSKTPGEQLRRGRVSEDRWQKILDACNKLAEAPLWVDDSSDTSVLDIRAKSRRLHHQIDGGLKLIIIDYLQLMRHEGRVESRVEQVGQISRGLKGLARELNVPVIALSQLSRAVEQRGGAEKKPILSDLRECVTGETQVVLAGGQRVPIRGLVGTEPEVLALDQRQRIVPARSDAVWCVGRRPVFRLKLDSGRHLRATAEHRVLVGAGWRRLSELQVGDRVALARHIPEPVQTERWPDDRVILLGQLIGDGSYLKHGPMRYTTASEANSHAVTRTATKEFGAKVKRYAGRRSWHQLLISGNGNRWHPAGVGAWLKELGIFGQRSHEKRLPEAAFRLPSDQVALLLRHLWATDGCIWWGNTPSGPRSMIYYATSSSGLAGDVACLLLRLGIVARTKVVVSHGKQCWHVLVSGGEAMRRFLGTVGAFGPRIEPALILSASLGLPNTNVDTLPREIWQVIRAAMAEQGLRPRDVASRRGLPVGGPSQDTFAPSRATVLSYAKALDSAELRMVAESDIFWDKVISIEPDGEEEVYDLTVPGPANWLADGLITHNSGNIEQDSDLVMFIYRDEYYNKESERQGEADIIVAKHRNGPVGEVTLTFQHQYPRFMNYARDRFAA